MQEQGTTTIGKLHSVGIYLITFLKKEYYSVEEIYSTVEREYRNRTGRELFDRYRFCEVSKALPQEVSKKEQKKAEKQARTTRLREIAWGIFKKREQLRVLYPDDIHFLPFPD